MKALITAGGHGTRLRPLTYTVNKHLIPIANKPMIFHALDKIAKVGIKEVAININEGDKILPQIVGDGSTWGLKITYIEQIGGALGLAHIIKNAADWIGNDDLLFYLGDNIILGEITDLVQKFHDEKADCVLALAKVKDPKRFGVPEIKDGKIIGVVEKPSEPKSNYAVTGIYVYNNNILKAVQELKPSARGELEISDAHQWFIDNNLKVTYQEITGWWKDTGKPEDLLEGNALILTDIENNNQASEIHERARIQGKVIIEEGVKIGDNVLIRGPVVIGKNAVLENCYIGPYTAIGHYVEIYNAEIEHSIVLDYADINCDKRIVDSIIGANATISNVHLTKPNGHRLILGENSAIEL
ncbi:MAG TPA: glucose-1-phosphate thymidylyltransferase [bacterium]|nr:glucose-1-phosphate thymidylyltransferase [bacterium]